MKSKPKFKDECRRKGKRLPKYDTAKYKQELKLNVDFNEAIQIVLGHKHATNEMLS